MIACYKLKKVCSGFNFVDELFMTISQLESEASMLTSTEARKCADHIIVSLKEMANQLSQNNTESDFMNMLDAEFKKNNNNTNIDTSLLIKQFKEKKEIERLEMEKIERDRQARKELENRNKTIFSQQKEMERIKAQQKLKGKATSSDGYPDGNPDSYPDSDGDGDGDEPKEKKKKSFFGKMKKILLS